MVLALNSRNTDAGLNVVVFSEKRPGVTAPEPWSVLPTMNAYASNAKGACARCGERTTRSELCRACGRDEYRESNLTDTEPAGPPVYECVDCGATFRAGGLDPCPECDSFRHTQVSD